MRAQVGTVAALVMLLAAIVGGLGRPEPGGRVQVPAPEATAVTEAVCHWDASGQRLG